MFWVEKLKTVEICEDCSHVKDVLNPFVVLVSPVRRSLMKNKDKKAVNNTTYQFGVSNSDLEKGEWNWEKILDELEAIGRLRDLSTEIAEMADREEWSLEKILAKIDVLKLCKSYNRQYSKRYLTLMPTNLYGPHDNFHPENNHVIPGMMRRIH